MRTLVPLLFVALAIVLIACATTVPPRSSSRTSAGPTSCAGRVGADPNVYDTTQVTERPIVRNAPPPAYPPLLRDEGVQGRVVISLIVKSDGAADSQSVRVVREVHPALDTAVVKWALTAQFWPGCLREEPVAVRITVPIEFTIGHR
jgi:TonB family protein